MALLLLNFLVIPCTFCLFFFPSFLSNQCRTAELLCVCVPIFLLLKEHPGIVIIFIFFFCEEKEDFAKWY